MSVADQPQPDLAARAAAALIDGILAKVKRTGLAGLTPDELAHFNLALGKSPVPATGAPAPAPDFRLLPARAKLTAADRQHLCALYGKPESAWKTLYSWIQLGEKNGDPTPIHDPCAMLEWWPRHHTWCVRPEIVAAADRQKKAALESATPLAETPIASAGAPSSPQPTAPAIDLASLDPTEGDRFRHLQQIVAARGKEIDAAWKSGQPSASLEAAYRKSCVELDQMETRITERLKARGLYILVRDVENDAARACEMLAQFRASMEARVLELCPTLNGDQRREVAAAIQRTRAHEDTILSRLNCLSADDLLKELHAA